ncbi:RNA recognition motif domain-containing protein [Pedobacter frigoris]|uniref:RNA-binding protein n=1 Tax=Pedobacter frigoris TaxID=2571272 RepID=A0A4U1CK44_9SPHI|nr:RNA-binding protein [Pedobacter frigoris]TKC06996.1 RNA-binding protein [Pedobacter frigoris]
MVKLHVVGFPSHFGEIELLELFSLYVIVDDLYFVTDRNTGLKLGYAFVGLKDEIAADRAIANINGSMIGRNKLKVSLAITRSSK